LKSIQFQRHTSIGYIIVYKLLGDHASGPLAFDIWEKMKKEEARFRAHTKV
jgi:hypothetical protein